MNSILVFFRYPCWMTARLLLECGIDVNHLNINRDTALHIFARNSTISHRLRMIDLLYVAGVHLDYVNKQKQTALELIPNNQHEIIEELKKKMNVTRLKCLCAQRIRREEFFYQNSLLSKSLVNFVEKH